MKPRGQEDVLVGGDGLPLAASRAAQGHAAPSPRGWTSWCECDCGHDQSPPGLARWINGKLYCENCADAYDTENWTEHDDDDEPF